MRTGLRSWVIAHVALALLALPIAAESQVPSLSLCIPRTERPAVGLSLAGTTPVDERISDLALTSAAMGAVEHVDVMVPSHYDPSGATRYRTLYLLHGATGDYRDFVAHGIEDIVGDLPVIVVMPDGGPFGSYSDWYGQTALFGPDAAAPAWETFHTEELIPWIDAHYRTTGSRAGRAVAGISMGGMGAMKYAARHPELFAAAGSFSGAVDIDLGFPAYPLASQILWGATLRPNLGPPAFCTWGDPVTQDVLWRDNNPTYLASNLGGVALYVAGRDGAPGPLDRPVRKVDSAAGLIEQTVWSMNQSFVRALNAAGITFTDALHGAGTHSWPYWDGDLRAFVPWATSRMGTDSPPASFSYRSARSSFSAWGWSFTAERRVGEFLYLTGVGPAGLTARGSGRLRVATAPLYRPGALFRVTTGGSAQPLQSVRAGRDGRLRFGVDLAPSHLFQQYVFDPLATLTFPVATVQIRAGS